MNSETVTRELYDTTLNKKHRCIAELRAERESLKETIKRYEDRKILFQGTIADLRASLRDMVEWTEKYHDSMEDGYSWDGDEKCLADIVKARGLL